MAHTRWATHGKPSQENAHPHVSNNGKWVIVHNGIIENCDELNQGIKPYLKGETDTEVLVEFLASKTNNATIFEFIKAFESVEGSYAVVCQNSSHAKSLYLAKNKSPLYVAKGKTGVLVASDPICFAGFCNNYFIMEDKNFAFVTDKTIQFYDISGSKVDLKPHKLQNFEKNAEKELFPHFMLKEFYEQPKALRRQLREYQTSDCLKQFDKKFLSNFDNVVFLGSGSANHAGMIGKTYFEEILHITSKAVIASEFEILPFINVKKTLFIIVSQSGETADALTALEKILDKDGTVIAVTNVLHSTLAQKASYVLPIFAGPEIAVASTKAYVCQISALYVLTQKFCGNKNFDKEIIKLIDKILDFDKSEIEKIAEKIIESPLVLFIGKHMGQITARESALKVQEISYIPSLALSAGELKHGYLALVNEKAKVFVFGLEQKYMLSTLNSANEAMARGAEIFEISSKTLKNLQNVNEYLLPILAVVPMQYLAYVVSVKKGINPDKPRNLAKSVTVG
jgi:glucosamine--fructose-6-phosphate aminotransferase (isomerizing)